MREYTLLILGAGWTATHLIPLCNSRNISVAATTRDGREVGGLSTLKWSFDPKGGHQQFSALPLAKNVLVTFPLTGNGQSQLVKEGYEAIWGSRLGDGGARVIQLGSAGIWQNPAATESSIWISRHSPYATTNARAIAEDELTSLGGTSLNLAGLWDGEARDARDWIDRVAKTKEDVKGKRSLHMVHGVDVARAVLAVIGKWESARGERWMVTDGFVYDWWALFAGWADVKPKSKTSGEAGAGASQDHGDSEPNNQAKWTYELMREEDVRALPRSMEALARCYDSREFWETFGLAPLKARVI